MFIRKPFHQYTQRGAVDGGAVENIVTIFSQALDANDAGFTDYALRSNVEITGGPGDTNKIRVTFEADSTLSFTVERASVGISARNDYDVGYEDCTATPVALTFDSGGANGFTITAGQTKVSDWATLGGFTSSNHLNVTIDCAGSNANPRIKLGLGINKAAFTSAANQYDQQNITQSGDFFGRVLGFNKIEVK